MLTLKSLYCAALVGFNTATAASAACNIVNGVAYGDCAGVTVNTGRASFVVVETYRSLTGVSEGAQVLSGGSLSVSGTADRVIVDQGATADISGIVHQLEVRGTARVSGQVRFIQLQDGGRVTIEGTVGGIFGKGRASLEAGSVVAGRPTKAAIEVIYD